MHLWILGLLQCFQYFSLLLFSFRFSSSIICHQLLKNKLWVAQIYRWNCFAWFLCQSRLLKKILFSMSGWWLTCCNSTLRVNLAEGGLVLHRKRSCRRLHLCLCALLHLVATSWILFLNLQACCSVSIHWLFPHMTSLVLFLHHLKSVPTLLIQCCLSYTFIPFCFIHFKRNRLQSLEIVFHTSWIFKATFGFTCQRVFMYWLMMHMMTMALSS